MEPHILQWILSKRLDSSIYRIIKTIYDEEPQIQFLNIEDDTEENRTIIEDVINNYSTYCEEYNLNILREQVIINIQAILDNKSKEFGFDSIHTAGIWKDSKNPIRKKNSQDLLNWGDDVWDFAETEWALQELGTPRYTDIESFLAALPVFTTSE